MWTTSRRVTHLDSRCRERWSFTDVSALHLTETFSWRSLSCLQRYFLLRTRANVSCYLFWTAEGMLSMHWEPRPFLLPHALTSLIPAVNQTQLHPFCLDNCQSSLFGPDVLLWEGVMGSFSCLERLHSVCVGRVHLSVCVLTPFQNKSDATLTYCRNLKGVRFLLNWL